MCHQDFYNTTALRKAPRHGALRVPHARYGPRTASVAPPYMVTRNVLNNLGNDDALVLLGGHDYQKMCQHRHGLSLIHI